MKAPGNLPVYICLQSTHPLIVLFISYNMQDGNTAYDLASFEGHNHVCQELLTKQFS